MKRGDFSLQFSPMIHGQDARATTPVSPDDLSSGSAEA